MFCSEAVVVITLASFLDLGCVPFASRFNRMKEHPRTPDKMQGCSKRSWDGQVRKWRRMLHSWDPPATTTDGTAVSAEEALLAGM